MDKEIVIQWLADLKSPQEVAEILGIKKSTVQKWSKIFGIQKVLGVLLFTPEEVEMIRDRGDKRYGKKDS